MLDSDCGTAEGQFSERQQDRITLWLSCSLPITAHPSGEASAAVSDAKPRSLLTIHLAVKPVSLA